MLKPSAALLCLAPLLAPATAQADDLALTVQWTPAADDVPTLSQSMTFHDVRTGPLPSLLLENALGEVMRFDLELEFLEPPDEQASRQVLLLANIHMGSEDDQGVLHLERVSSPRIVTLVDTEATIKQGERALDKRTEPTDTNWEWTIRMLPMST